MPQGSVLGPLLFLIFVNDVSSELVSNVYKVKLFADDLKCYNVIDYRSNSEIVQTKLDSLINWSDTWQLKLSLPKCGSLLLCGYSSFIDMHVLTASSEALGVIDIVKDIGVFIDCQLSFSKQLNSVISKAKQRIYLIINHLFHVISNYYLLPTKLIYCRLWTTVLLFGTLIN